MPIYEKPVRELMHDWAATALSPGQIFSKQAAVDWFGTHYPLVASSTVGMHVEGMATNNVKRRIHHPNIRSGTGHDLFYKIGPDQFRLYDEANDPVPRYGTDGLTDPALMPKDEEALEVDERLSPELLEEAREFAYERDLQNFLARNLTVIEPGLRLYRDEEEGIVGVEYMVGNRRIDILAVDRDDRFVVIELKVSRGYDRVLGQIARYMAWVGQNLGNDTSVRGIIIARAISDDLRLAASLIPGVELLEYTMNFQLKRVSDRKT